MEKVGDQWFVDTSMGRVAFAFAPTNEFGILDHDVTLPSGEVVYNPMRVTKNGGGSEVVFSLRRLPGMTDAEFERDARAVLGDLTRLKNVIESHQPSFTIHDAAIGLPRHPSVQRARPLSESHPWKLLAPVTPQPGLVDQPGGEQLWYGEEGIRNAFRILNIRPGPSCRCR